MGAYGRSDGVGATAGGDWNVPAAVLSLVANQYETDGDDFSDAIEVFYSHVTHQGTLYEVTPHALPFLIELANTLAARARVIVAEVVSGIVASGRRAVGSANAAEADVGRRILHIAVQHTESFLQWHDARARAVACIAAHVPDIRMRYVECLVGKAGRLSAAQWLIVALSETVPDNLAARARKALFAKDRLTNIAAGLIVARSTSLPADVSQRLESIFDRHAQADFRNEFRDSIPMLSFPSGPFTKPSEERVDGAILFVGTRLVTASVAGRRNVTLRWVPEGLRKGARVCFGFYASGEPRLLEWTTDDGRVHRIDIYPDGMRMGSPAS